MNDDWGFTQYMLLSISNYREVHACFPTSARGGGMAAPRRQAPPRSLTASRPGSEPVREVNKQGCGSHPK